MNRTTELQALINAAVATILLQKRVLKEALGLAIARLTHFSYHQMTKWCRDRKQRMRKSFKMRLLII
jgi:hypothetical protein